MFGHQKGFIEVEEGKKGLQPIACRHGKSGVHSGLCQGGGVVTEGKRKLKEGEVRTTDV